MDNETRHEQLTPLVFEHDNIATFTVSDSSDPTGEYTRRYLAAMNYVCLCNVSHHTGPTGCPAHPGR